MVGIQKVGVVALVVALVAVAPVTAVASAGGQHGPRGPTAAASSVDAAASSAVPGVAQQTDAQACNYTDLYDRTIDSVVLVRTGGGLGSGFVYEADDGTSYVVTNQHVVNDSATVEIQFAEGENARGQVVGATAFVDLAVVRVNETPGYVEALALADGQPQPGERVAAVGSPYGLESTITSGIVSGVDRLTPTQAGLIPNTVQTDAPINPGNSGGPLVACDSGEVVGVNRAGGGDNIGFAVSAVLVERIVPELVEQGEYDYPYVGIAPAQLTQSIVEANDLNVTRGVYVAETVDGSPAADVLRGATGTEIVADRRVPVGGDVIVAIGNRTVETPEDLLSYLLTDTRPGDEVEVTVVRDGERRTLTVTIGERPDPAESA